MPKTILSGLAVVAAALTLAATGAAATITIQIRSTGFAPSSVTVDHGDRVTFHNADKTDHQVVADSGAFASPILHAGQSWTTTLSTAGTFRYHDALHPALKGKIVVKGPPPSVTLGLSVPIVTYGGSTLLAGAISTGAANQSVEIDQQQWGQPSATQLVIVKTGTGGTFSFAVTPSLYTTYVARWNNVASAGIVAQVEPKLRLVPGGGGYMRASVSAPVSMWHRHVFLQRLSSFGQWVNVAALMLGPQSGKLFRPVALLPKGVSHIRVSLSVNQAGNGLLGAHSGTQTIVRRR
jgi:plastocyanin